MNPTHHRGCCRSSQATKRVIPFWGNLHIQEYLFRMSSTGWNRLKPKEGKIICWVIVMRKHIYTIFQQQYQHHNHQHLPHHHDMPAFCSIAGINCNPSNISVCMSMLPWPAQVEMLAVTGSLEKLATAHLQWTTQRWTTSVSWKGKIVIFNNLPSAVCSLKISPPTGCWLSLHRKDHWVRKS